MSVCSTGENTKLETECGMVVCADDPELLDKLDQAAEKGETQKKFISLYSAT